MKISDTPAPFFFKQPPLILATPPFLWKMSEQPSLFFENFQSLQLMLNMISATDIFITDIFIEISTKFSEQLCQSQSAITFSCSGYF